MWCKGMDLESLFGGRYLGLDMEGKCEAMEKYKLKSDQFNFRGWLRRLLVEAYVQAHEVFRVCRTNSLSVFWCSIRLLVKGFYGVYLN